MNLRDKLAELERRVARLEALSPVVWAVGEDIHDIKEVEKRRNEPVIPHPPKCGCDSPFFAEKNMKKK